jgi:hypothetical protein
MVPEDLQFAYQHAAASILRVQRERLARTRTLTTLRGCKCLLIAKILEMGVSEEELIRLLNLVCEFFFFFFPSFFFPICHHHIGPC